MRSRKKNKLWIAAGICMCLTGGAILTGCGSAAKTGGTSAASETAQPEIQTGETKIIKVGFDGATVPCSWAQRDSLNGAVPIAGSDEYLCGFEVEYMKKLCQLSGYEMEAYKIDWDGLMMAVSSGKIDCAIAMIAPTDERKHTMNFTKPYYNANTVVVTRKDSPYANASSLAEFSGAKITSMLNTLWYNQIDQIPGVNKAPAMENIPVMLVAVKSGTIDGILLDEPTARGSVASNPELAVAPVVSGEGGFKIDPQDTSVAIAVNKDNEKLLNDLNSAIDQTDTKMLNSLIGDACSHAPSGN